jgi:hypothetical protein
MTCKKSELVAAVNSYASARLTNDGPLVKMAAEALQNVVDTLEFAPEEEIEESETEEVG